MGNNRRGMALGSLAVLLALVTAGGRLAAGIACLGLGAAVGAVAWRLHHAWLLRHY
jgi:hypothetical protein